MKYFVLTALRLYDELEELSDSLDKTIARAATSLKGDTQELCYYIMELNDKKRILANLKVICDRIKNEIGENECTVLKRYAGGTPCEELAAQDGVSRSTAMRRLNKLTGRCVVLLQSLGVSGEKIEKEYFSLPVVKAVYDFIAARKSPKRSSIERKRKIRGEGISFCALEAVGGIE